MNPGQSLTGSVTFKPSAAQAYSGALEFTRANGSTISVALSGTGTGQTPPSAGRAHNLFAAGERENHRGTNGNI